MYVARPFNFNLSPLFLYGELLKINRDVTLSTNAIMFLMKNSFDMGTVFTSGVTYLSRHEELAARKFFMGNLNHSSSVPDIIIPPGDREALNFYRNARQTVTSWVKQKKVFNLSKEQIWPY